MPPVIRSMNDPIPGARILLEDGQERHAHAGHQEDADGGPPFGVRPYGYPDPPVDQEELQLSEDGSPVGDPEILVEGPIGDEAADHPAQAVGQQDPVERLPGHGVAPAHEHHQGHPDHADQGLGDPDMGDGEPGGQARGDRHQADQQEGAQQRAQQDGRHQGGGDQEPDRVQRVGRSQPAQGQRPGGRHPAQQHRPGTRGQPAPVGAERRRSGGVRTGERGEPVSPHGRSTPGSRPRRPGRPRRDPSPPAEVDPPPRARPPGARPSRPP